MNTENFIALIVSALVGAYLLYCLYRPEDL